MIIIAKRNSIKAQRPQAIRPAPDGKRIKLPELKSIKFNYIPPDGFCGYRAIYNASKDIKIEEDKNISREHQRRLIHKIRKNLDPKFLKFLKDIKKTLEKPEAHNITSNYKEIKDNLENWFKEYETILPKYPDISKLFNEKGEPELRPVINKFGFRSWPKIKALRGLGFNGFADEAILGYLGNKLGLNIFMIYDIENKLQYFKLNEFKIDRKTILLKNEGCHWEWANLGTEYNSALSKHINENVRKKYLKYKKKYLLLKSKLK